MHVQTFYHKRINYRFFPELHIIQESLLTYYVTKNLLLYYNKDYDNVDAKKQNKKLKTFLPVNVCIQAWEHQSPCNDIHTVRYIFIIYT